MTRPFQVVLTVVAQEDLKRLDHTTRTQLFDKLEWMGENAELLRHQALEDKWSGTFKYRVGNYRIIYQLDRTTGKLVVLKARHRREVYK